MKEPITVAGKMTLPADHAAHVLHPKAETAVYTVYEIAGARYISISGNTRNTVELTALKDLYVDTFDGLLKANRAPIHVNAADMPTVYTSSLKELEPVDILKERKKYYFVTNETDVDRIYGNIEPYCMTEEEVKHLSAEWNVDLFEQMHEATAEELAQFGTGVD